MVRRQTSTLDQLFLGLRPLTDAGATFYIGSAGVYAHFVKAEGIIHRPVNPSQKLQIDEDFPYPEREYLR